MVEGGTDKRHRVVTDGAVLAGRNMDRRHTRRCLSIVTGGAVIDDAGMIKDGRGETAGYMTDAAIGARRHMIDRLTDRRHAIMARCAVGGDAGVIEHRTDKAGCVMTNTAILARGNVRRRFRQGADHRVRTAMAGDAISGDAGMREYRRIERRRRVAGFAILAGWHVQHCRILAKGKPTVVTTRAASADAGMDKAEKSRYGKAALAGISVAQAAIILCRDMILGLADGDVSIMASGAVVSVYAQMIEGDARKGLKEIRAVT